MKKVKINDHTKFKTDRRSISEEIIKSVVENPQQKLPSRKDRVILQSRYYDTNEGKEKLLRVIGIESTEEFRVITAYKTSKIDKCWQKGG